MAAKKKVSKGKKLPAVKTLRQPGGPGVYKF